MSRAILDVGQVLTYRKEKKEILNPICPQHDGECDIARKLKAILWRDRWYRASCLMCFTETWLQEHSPSANPNIDGFVLFCVERSH